jgi:hypothetical protein
MSTDNGRGDVPSLERYVAHELAITQRLLDGGASNPIVDGKDRMQRCEDYARWRYAAFMSGEVVSL